MNRKLVFTSAGCFGLGALVSWAVTADYHERQARRNRAAFRRIIERQGQMIEKLETDPTRNVVDILDEGMKTRQIDEVEQHSLSLDPKPNAFGEPVHIIEDEKSPEGTASETPVEDDDVVDEVVYEEQRSNLKEMISRYVANEAEADHFVHTASPTLLVTYDPPFVISQAVFAWDPNDEGNDYEKTTIKWFENDRVLVDEDDEAIEQDQINSIVGWKNLNRFGDESGDADVVFIRNRRMMTDFEVVREIEEPLPTHIRYSMGKEEFRIGKAAGIIKIREEDQ